MRTACLLCVNNVLNFVIVFRFVFHKLIKTTTLLLDRKLKIVMELPSLS